MSTLQRCQLKLAKLYRARAHTALAKARQARDSGNMAAARSHLGDARLWRRFAGDWMRQAHRAAP